MPLKSYKMKKILIIIMMLFTVVATSQGYTRPISNFATLSGIETFTGLKTFDTGDSFPLIISNSSSVFVDLKFSHATGDMYLGIGEFSNLLFGSNANNSLNDIVFHEGNANRTNTGWTASQFRAENISAYLGKKTDTQYYSLITYNSADNVELGENSGDLVFRSTSGNQIVYHSGIANNNTVDWSADTLRGNNINLSTLPVFADDTAAASLNQGDVYRTVTGELRIKL
jgi:hypothetical protein